MQRHPHSGERRVVLPTRRSFVDRPPRSQQASAGYSLIELIVAIAIVAILLAILLPAIQAVRESSRRTACNNHLRQMSLGILQHESKTGYLITGGWSPLWLGVAERSADGRQLVDNSFATRMRRLEHELRGHIAEILFGDGTA